MQQDARKSALRHYTFVFEQQEEQDQRHQVQEHNQHYEHLLVQACELDDWKMLQDIRLILPGVKVVVVVVVCDRWDPWMDYFM